MSAEHDRAAEYAGAAGDGAADGVPNVRHPHRTRVVRMRFTLADRAALDRFCGRYAAEHGRMLSRTGAVRMLTRAGLARADERSLSDVLGDVDPDIVSRRPSSDGNAAA